MGSGFLGVANFQALDPLDLVWNGIHRVSLINFTQPMIIPDEILGIRYFGRQNESV